MTARKANGQFTREPAFMPGIADWPRFDHATADQLITAAREASSAYESSFGAWCTVIDVAYAPPPVVLVSSKPLDDAAGPLLTIEAPDPGLDARVAALMAHYDEDPLDVPAPDDGAAPPAPSTINPPDGAPGAGTQDDPALD